MKVLKAAKLAPRMPRTDLKIGLKSQPVVLLEMGIGESLWAGDHNRHDSQITSPTAGILYWHTHVHAFIQKFFAVL